MDEEEILYSEKTSPYFSRLERTRELELMSEEKMILKRTLTSTIAKNRIVVIKCL